MLFWLLSVLVQLSQNPLRLDVSSFCFISQHISVLTYLIRQQEIIYSYMQWNAFTFISVLNNTIHEEYSFWDASPCTLVEICRCFRGPYCWLLGLIFDCVICIQPTQPPIQWVPGSHSPGVKRPEREANHSPPTSAEVKKMWIYTSTPPYAFVA
jgi:hypothetical protein